MTKKGKVTNEGGVGIVWNENDYLTKRKVYY